MEFVEYYWRASELAIKSSAFVITIFFPGVKQVKGISCSEYRGTTTSVAISMVSVVESTKQVPHQHHMNGISCTKYNKPITSAPYQRISAAQSMTGLPHQYHVSRLWQIVLCIHVQEQQTMFVSPTILLDYQTPSQCCKMMHSRFFKPETQGVWRKNKQKPKTNKHRRQVGREANCFRLVILQHNHHCS
jgi:hypothetical protein